MSYFKQHVFICTNQRDNGEACCHDRGGLVMGQYLKQQVAERGLDGPGKIRINRAGCLGRCAEGPLLVIYPEGVWYTFIDEADIDEILEEHLINGRVVERLQR